MAYVGKKKFGMTDAGMEASYKLAGETNTPITEVNEFGNDVQGMSLDKNRFGRRDNYNKKKMY